MLLIVLPDLGVSLFYGCCMFKKLMDITEVIIESSDRYHCLISISGFSGRYWALETDVAILSLALNPPVIPVSLAEQWHCQMSGDAATQDYALTYSQQRWWLTQQLIAVGDTLALRVRQQCQLAHAVQHLAAQAQRHGDVWR